MLSDRQQEELERIDRGLEESRVAVEKGRRAQEIMDDPLVVEAFQLIEDQWTQAWKNSKRLDADGRESAYRALAAAQDLKGVFSSMLEAGQNGKAMQSHLAKERETLLARVKRVVGL